MHNHLRPGDPASLLTLARRDRERDHLASGHAVDVLVVGGGVTGTGVALDAATRGMTVALIEAHDFAYGTSRWSSKMIHGGLRYLATGQVGVAWESSTERALIATTIAPHLVRAFPQLIPDFTDSTTKERVLARAGLLAGDALRRGTRLPKSVMPSPRRISAAEAIRLAPALPAHRLRGAVLGWDGALEDDARLVVAIARTAAAYGAIMLTRTTASEIDSDGATVQDTLAGGSYRINAKHVINATGVWAGTLDQRVTLSPSRGTHVVLRARDLGHPTAAITVPVPGHLGRFVFALPQPNGLIYVGLTDVPAPGPIADVPAATQDEIDWILDVLSQGLQRPIDRSQIVGSFAGLRPLVTAGDEEESADISRRHLVLGGPGEVVTVTGGKLTTYRRMAQDAVDRITDVPCVTSTVPLVGAGPTPANTGLPARLVRRFGAEAGLVAALADGDQRLLEPLTGADGNVVDVLGVELLWGVQAELGMTLADLLERRTRVSMVPADLAAVAPQAQQILADSGQLLATVGT